MKMSSSFALAANSMLATVVFAGVASATPYEGVTPAMNSWETISSSLVPWSASQEFLLSKVQTKSAGRDALRYALVHSCAFGRHYGW